jgi:hypothetical protein
MLINNINFTDYLNNDEEDNTCGSVAQQTSGCVSQQTSVCVAPQQTSVCVAPLQTSVCETNNIIQDNFCLLDDINYHSNNIKNELLENKIKVLNLISDTFKKLGQSIEYYKYYLNDIKQLKFFDDNILSMINSNNSNLYNMILIQKNNIDEIQNLKYILFNNIIIYHFHEINITLDEIKLLITIKQNNDSFTFNFPNLIIVDNDIIETIDNLILESVNLYDYFNSQYNKISSLINYLKINLH